MKDELIGELARLLRWLDEIETAARVARAETYKFLGMVKKAKVRLEDVV